MAMTVCQVQAPAGWLSITATGTPPDEATCVCVAQVAGSIIYASGATTDIIPAGTVATLYGGSTHVFDRATSGPWLILTVQGSLTLQFILESSLGTVAGTYAVLYRVLRHHTERWQQS